MLQQLVIGYGSVAINIIQGVALVPLYIKFIGVHTYGLWLATGGVLYWLSILDFGMAGLLRQRVAAAYGCGNRQMVGRYYCSAMILQCILAVLVVVVGVFVAVLLPKEFTRDLSEVRALRDAAVVASLATATTLLNFGQKNAADALQRPAVPQLVIVGAGAGGVIATALLLHGPHPLMAIPLGLLGGSVCSLIINAAYVVRLISEHSEGLSVDLATIRELLELSPALLAGKIGNSLVGRIEPTLLSLAATPEMVVAYSVTRRAGEVVQMIGDRLTGSISASFSHLFAEGKIARAREIASLFLTTWGCLAATGFAVFVTCNRTFVLLWIGGQHFAGQSVTVLIALALFLVGFANATASLLSSTGDIRAPSLIIAGESLVRATLMWTLVLRYGVTGMLLGCCVSVSLSVLAYLRRLSRQLDLRFPDVYKGISVAATIAVLFGVGSWVALNIGLATWRSFAVLCVVAITCYSSIIITTVPLARSAVTRLIIKLLMPVLK